VINHTLQVSELASATQGGVMNHTLRVSELACATLKRLGVAKSKKENRADFWSARFW